MQTARYQSEDVFKRLAAWTEAQVPGRVKLQAMVRVYGAYAYTFLGETYCTVALDRGPIQPPSAALTIAAARFAEAATLAAQAGPGSADFVHLANVGLARVNLDLKNWTAAATFAVKVPAGFEFFADRGIENSRRWNKIQYFATDLGAFVVSDAYRTMNDPRVPARFQPVHPAVRHHQVQVTRRSHPAGQLSGSPLDSRRSHRHARQCSGGNADHQRAEGRSWPRSVVRCRSGFGRRRQRRRTAPGIVVRGRPSSERPTQEEHSLEGRPEPVQEPPVRRHDLLADTDQGNQRILRPMPGRPGGAGCSGSSRSLFWGAGSFVKPSASRSCDPTLPQPVGPARPPNESPGRRPRRPGSWYSGKADPSDRAPHRPDGPRARE